MKPRIKREFRWPTYRWEWVCFGPDEQFGWGVTPQEAYAEWSKGR